MPGAQGGRRKQIKLERLTGDYKEGLTICTKNWGIILREVEALMDF